MEIHCNVCDNVESINSSDLTRSEGSIEVSEVLPTEGSLPSGRIPFTLTSIVEAIREQLPTWEANLEIENGTTSLRVICAKHFVNQNQKLIDLVSEQLEKAKERARATGNLPVNIMPDDPLAIVLSSLYNQYGYATLSNYLTALHIRNGN